MRLGFFCLCCCSAQPVMCLQEEEELESLMSRLQAAVSQTEEALLRTMAPNLKALEKMGEVTFRFEGVKEGAANTSTL